MSTVTSLWGDDIPPFIARGLREFENALIAAIEEAKEAHLPKGLVVALLHAYALEKTKELL